MCIRDSHRGRAPAWVWIAGAVLFIACAFVLAPKREPQSASIPFAQVQQVLQTRCVACHAERPSFQGLPEAPKGVKLDRPERVSAQALKIHQQSVLSRAMPPGNLTGMTDAERALLDRWYRSGASTQ